MWHTWFLDVFNRPSERNGFDIIIGNPPYGAKLSIDEKKIIKSLYYSARSVKNERKGSLDTYSLFIDLSLNLLCKNGFLAMIVPLSFTSSDSISSLHNLIFENCDNIRVSSYSVRPQPIFENAVVNTSIITLKKTMSPFTHIYSTKLYRKGKGFSLQNLIDNLEFVEVGNHLRYGRIPKIGTAIELSILNKISKQKKVGDFVKEAGLPIIYRFAGGRYFKVITNYSNNSSAERTLYFDDKVANPIGCILCSSLSFWFYQILSDNLNWKSYEIFEFPLPPLSNDICEILESLYLEYLKDIEINANIRYTTETSNYGIPSFKEYKIGKSKKIIDKIDDLICPLYGLTQEETNFIKNYEIEFRLSDDD